MLSKYEFGKHISGFQPEPAFSLYYEPLDDTYNKVSATFKIGDHTSPTLYANLANLIANPDLEYKQLNNEYGLRIFQMEDFEKQARKIEDRYI